MNEDSILDSLKKIDTLMRDKDSFNWYKGIYSSSRRVEWNFLLYSI
jgi:hypothetical protein